ncbi:aminotransferase class I and II [Flavobacterium sp. CBA20B-1]|nr:MULTISPECIES: HipA family kinase [unclassified Flavobacterium]WCM43467.1 aminotransferase class I and II [Flavobacterium sp. CBA20B-1]
MLSNLRTVTVTRYITPLREGGSLPALAEACDDFKYVIKFRGAGHGVKALISELLGGVIAQYLGLPVPELVFIELDEAFGQTEGDEEIQDLLKFSKGLNLGLHYLSGAVTYDVATNDCDELLASKIVWLDSFITNVDRTFRNTNLLIWHKELWLIDHGASFYFHHSWDNWQQTSQTPFALIKDHALIKKATKLQEVHEQFTAKLNNNVLRDFVNIIPDEFLNWEEGPSNEEIREVYYQFLLNRLAHADIFLKTAQNAR